MVIMDIWNISLVTDVFIIVIIRAWSQRLGSSVHPFIMSFIDLSTRPSSVIPYLAKWYPTKSVVILTCIFGIDGGFTI